METSVDPRPEMYEKYGHTIAGALYNSKVAKLSTKLTIEEKEKIYKFCIRTTECSYTLDEFKHEIDEIEIQGFPDWDNFCVYMNSILESMVLML